MHNDDPSTSKALTHDPEQMFRRQFLKYAGAAGVVAGAGALGACTTNPETGRSQFVALAPSTEALSQAANQSWLDVKSQTPTTRDPRYLGRLENIGRRVAQGAGQSDAAWEYAVFDTDTKNAFVMPGNKVGFYRGIMDFSDNDDQIATIIGHEMGHITGRHVRERYSQMMLGQIAVAGGTMLAGSQLQRRCRQATSQREYNDCMRSAGRNTQYLQLALGLGFQYGFVLPYSRKHEFEADQLGAKYMASAGYDPRQAVRLWEKMGSDGGARPPEFMSTHPEPDRRAQALSDYITAQEKLGSRGYQRLDIPSDA